MNADENSDMKIIEKLLLSFKLPCLQWEELVQEEPAIKLGLERLEKAYNSGEITVINAGIEYYFRRKNYVNG